jgi:hypothetical protein
MALRGREHQEADQILLGHRLRHWKVEVTTEIVDRGFLDLRDAGRVTLVTRIDLLGAHERLGLTFLGEVEPVPVDHRAPAQEDADPLEIGQGEIAETAELRDRHV